MSRWPEGAFPLLLAALLAASALLPIDWRSMVALAAIVVLGIPHGALDGEIARDVFRPRFGRVWFPVFAVPYLALSTLVLVAWHMAPLWTLAGFLSASVYHFGAEEAANGSTLERLVRGGLPIAVPTLAHAGSTALVFSVVTGQTLAGPPVWLEVGAVLWTVSAVVWSVQLAAERRWRPATMAGLVACCFLALPPLTGFAIYFVCIHAPAHTASLTSDRGSARRVYDGRSALVRAIPLSLLTLLIGAALWPYYKGPVPERLLSVTLQGLAALTLPHLLLESLLPRLRLWFAPASPTSRHGRRIGAMDNPTTVPKERPGLQFQNANT